MIHQGERLEEILKAEGKSKKFIAGLIGKSEQTVSGYKHKAVLDVEIIARITDHIEANLFEEFYPQYMVKKAPEVSGVKEEGLTDTIIEKYRLEGKVQQLEQMLKNNLAQEITTNIVEKYEKQLSSIAAQTLKLELQIESLKKLNISAREKSA